MHKHLAISGIPLPALSRDFENIVLPPDPLLDAPVQNHPDMLLTVFKGNLYCHESYYKDNKDLLNHIAKKAGLSVITGSEKRCSTYPYDCGYNTLVLGDTLIGRRESLSPILSSLCEHNTNQGYAGCTALYARGTVITADKSTVKACQSGNIPYFEISGEDILLWGYNTGFIGGACGVFEDKIYIYGSYEKSKSGMELKGFCDKNSLTLFSLFDGPVTDIGGIKFI